MNEVSMYNITSDFAEGIDDMVMVNHTCDSRDCDFSSQVRQQHPATQMSHLEESQICFLLNILSFNCMC